MSALVLRTEVRAWANAEVQYEAESWWIRKDRTRDDGPRFGPYCSEKVAHEVLAERRERAMQHAAVAEAQRDAAQAIAGLHGFQTAFASVFGVAK